VNTEIRMSRLFDLFFKCIALVKQNIKISVNRHRAKSTLIDIKTAII